MIRRLLPTAALAIAMLPAHAGNLSALVDRYVAWRGGEAFEHLQSLRFQGSLDTAGLHGTEAVWAARSGRLRVDVDLGVLKTTQVVAPSGGWDTSPSGQVESLSLADRISLSRDMALQFPDALRGRGGAKAALAGDRKRDGRTWSVVRVRFGDTDVYDVLIDPKTGELGGFDITEDREERFEAFGDWRKVAGVRMAFVQTTESAIPGGNQTLKVTSLALNVPIAPGRLARPAPVRDASFEDGATSTGWINFEFFHHNRIYFPAKVNGHDTIVLLDSGASVSAADKAFAASIGLTSHGAFTAPGAGGITTTGFASGVDIQIGALTLHGVKVATFDFAPIGRRIGHPLPFVLGSDVFNQFAVDIDFAHRRLAFRNPDSLTRPAGAVEVSLTRVKDRAVPIAIEGAAPVPFEFDLGDGAPLDIAPAYYEPRRLLRGRRTSQVEAGGVGGFHGETIATIRRLAFAGVEFHDVPATFTSDKSSADNSNLLFGTVGLPLLARFHLIVDYTHDRLFATPYPNAAVTPFVRDRLGAVLARKDGAVAVQFVSPGSPAQAAGLKVGDRVAEIDGKPAGAWGDADITQLRFQKAGAVVHIVLENGAAKNITCENFF
jgi:Aspartyl protease/PDZ domain